MALWYFFVKEKGLHQSNIQVAESIKKMKVQFSCKTRGAVLQQRRVF